jgi:hypothetical protein
MNKTPEIQQAIQEGQELWQALVEVQNAIIKEEDKIKRDDKRIWSPFAHKWDNTDWVKILLALKEADREHGLLGTEADHIEIIQNVLTKYWDYDDRILDKRDDTHKAKTWKMMMMMREIWNRIYKIDIKNDTRISKKSDSVYNDKNRFNSLFKID